MGLRVAAGTWGLFSVVMWAVLLEELLSGVRPERLFLAAALGTATAWLGYRLWRRPSRTIAVIAGCCGAFLVLLAVYSLLRDSLEFLPAGVALVVIAILGGWLPMRHRRSLT